MKVPPRMTTQSSFFHALLRPAILQILRATGYHSAKPSVVDSLTEITARYLSALCEATASHAVHNHGDAAEYSLAEVRMALHDVGALSSEEDFVEWFAGARMKELMSDDEDYLHVLKRKHAKTADESKYAGTVVGRQMEGTAEVQVEGGPVTSIKEWNEARVPSLDVRSPTVSSGLSSVGSRLDDDMELV